MKKILGALSFGIFLLAGHAIAIAQIYGRPVTLEQILWFIPHYLLYLFYIGSTGFLGWIFYQFITKGINQGLDRILKRKGSV